jgi:hypothetical protein
MRRGIVSAQGLRTNRARQHADWSFCTRRLRENTAGLTVALGLIDNRVWERLKASPGKGR